MLNIVALLSILLFAQADGFGAEQVRQTDSLSGKRVRPLVFRASGQPMARVTGLSQQPKFIVDTLTFNGGSAKLKLNTDLNAGKHRTMPTSAERFWVLSVHPAHLVKIDSSKLDMNKKHITFWRNGSDTVKATIQLLVQ